MGCLGFARFGYTLILPAMQATLGLSNTQTGVLATGNFVGYLAMATIGGFVASRYGARRVIVFFMLLTALGMGLTGLAGGFWGAIAWRVLTGVGSGGSNVPVMALLSSWFAPRRRGLASGIAVSGSSLALIVIGFLVPRILNAYEADGWRYSWYVLGAGVLLLGILGFALLRERPEERGLRPIGAQAPDRAEPPLPASGSAQRQAVAPDWGRIYRSGSLWHLALVYVAFGFSYVIYTTFFAKYLQAEAGYTKEAAGSLWTIVGWISIFCGLIWGSVSDAIGRQYGLALVYGLQAISLCPICPVARPCGTRAFCGVLWPDGVEHSRHRGRRVRRLRGRAPGPGSLWLCDPLFWPGAGRRSERRRRAGRQGGIVWPGLFVGGGGRPGRRRGLAAAAPAM